MRLLVLTLIISALAAGFSFAADTQDGKSQPKSPHQKIYKPASPFSTGKFSKMLSDMVAGALSLDISDDQKKKVSELRQQYVVPISDEETEIRQTQMDIMKMLEDPAFDAAKVKEEIDSVNAASKKVSDQFIDGLASLRDTVGEDNYKTLGETLSSYQHNLVQMRKHSRYPSSDLSDKKKSTSGQTSPPATKDNGI